MLFYNFWAGRSPVFRIAVSWAVWFNCFDAPLAFCASKHCLGECAAGLGLFYVTRSAILVSSDRFQYSRTQPSRLLVISVTSFSSLSQNSLTMVFLFLSSSNAHVAPTPMPLRVCPVRNEASLRHRSAREPPSHRECTDASLSAPGSF